MNDTSFSSLGLAAFVLEALAKEGYERPTPIQAASIPSLLAGRDLLGVAQTGTGKTAAFALPIIQLLSSSQTRAAARGCRALIVAPTRELAAQIDTSFGAYGATSKLTRACVFGGVGKAPQMKALGRGVDVLTATPGRLLDLHSEGQLRLDSVEIVVLDEADRMLDMGFIRDVRRIIALLPARRQTLLFSATMPSDIASLASTVLKDPVRVSVSPEKPTVDLIDQKVAFVEKADKRAYLAALIEAQGAERAIVFTRTKHGADRLARSLESSGIPAQAIHANKSQNNRTRTMEGFRTGTLRVLVATDLAARGIDVDGVTHVYNYELPDVAETYVHRIGRTARAGASGAAVALCDTEEKPLLRAIEKLMRKDVPVGSGPAFEAAAEAARTAPRLPERSEGERHSRGGEGREGRARTARRPSAGAGGAGRSQERAASGARTAAKPARADERPARRRPEGGGAARSRPDASRAQDARPEARRSDRPAMRPASRPASRGGAGDARGRAEPGESGRFSIDDVTGLSSIGGNPSRRRR
jgi:ATP-dependent RNA helicase RhlE